MADRRRVSIFGSTGSVGANTVDLIIRQGGAARYDVVALTGQSNIALLADQAQKLQAKLAVTADPAQEAGLRDALSGSGIAIASGPEGLRAAAEQPTDWSMQAIVGAAGLEPSLIAATTTDTLALANKESLVCAGALLKATCAKHDTRLLPVDSEHSAIFQALRGERMAEVARIILTASGGPFRSLDADQIAKATPEQAVAHPNWSMGQRISIDSASLFNKALEMIETKELFDLPPEAIDVVIHPQSIIHSLVEFTDGAVMAHLGPPDMRAPIGFALNYPDRAPLPLERLDLAAIGRLDFEPPDPARFPALRLAQQVMSAGGLTGAVMNAAKEVALDRFLAGNMGFHHMSGLVSDVLEVLGPEAAGVSGIMDLQQVLDFDARARRLGQGWTVPQS